MKLYRICTENKNYQNITEYLDANFPDGYTIINANGARQGIREKSLVIEIVENPGKHTDKQIKHFAYWLRKHNQQQVILVQIIEIDRWLI